MSWTTRRSVVLELEAVQGHHDLALADAQKSAVGDHQIGLVVRPDQHVLDLAELKVGHSG
jgi:hypothetical protein